MYEHLHQDVPHFKRSLNEVWSFPYENHLQVLKENDSKTQFVRLQKGREGTAQKAHTAPKTGDCCFLLMDDNFASVLEKRSEGTLVTNVIRQDDTQDLFESPCKSKLFDIVYVKTPMDKAKRCLLQHKNLHRKAVRRNVRSLSPYPQYGMSRISGNCINTIYGCKLMVMLLFI